MARSGPTSTSWRRRSSASWKALRLEVDDPVRGNLGEARDPPARVAHDEAPDRRRLAQPEKTGADPRSSESARIAAVPPPALDEAAATFGPVEPASSRP